MNELQTSSWTAPERWTRTELETAGFLGWRRFAALDVEGDPLPRVGGVYVVHRPSGGPKFLAINPAGRFKGRDPSVSAVALRANWVPDAEVIYIGKADVLRRRLLQYKRFGEGEPIGHWGGRLIWQLADSAALLVAWHDTTGRVPREVETEMIAAFKRAFGKPPFANEPHRLGRLP